MSAFGQNKNCRTNCYCHDCKFRDEKCAVCMDCQDVPSDEFDDDYGNGYIPKNNPSLCSILCHQRVVL